MQKWTRRRALLGIVTAAALPHSAFANPFYGESDSDTFVRDPALIPPPESPIDYPIEPINLSSNRGMGRAGGTGHHRGRSE
jgi:hypothetical protein